MRSSEALSLSNHHFGGVIIGGRLLMRLLMYGCETARFEVARPWPDRRSVPVQPWAQLVWAG
jgi:hypothetical protein